MNKMKKILVGGAVIVVLISLILGFPLLKEKKGSLTVNDYGTGGEKTVTISFYPKWAWQLPGIDGVERLTVDNCEATVWGGGWKSDMSIYNMRLPRQEEDKGADWTKIMDLEKRYEVLSLSQCRAKFVGNRVA